jgi:rhomboid family GlyGly-CTERM serine protease
MGLSQGEETRPGASPFQAWLLPMGLAAIAVALIATGDSGRELLRYDRGWLADGEFWRALSGHLVHLGVSHAVLNVAGLLLVWYLVGTALSTREWLWVIAGSAAGVSAGLWFFSPQVAWYVGLSGLLHGLLAAGVIAQFRQHTIESAVIGAVVIGKLVYEQVLGPLPGSESTSGGNVVVDAHLYGFIGGSLVALVMNRVRTKAAI